MGADTRVVEIRCYTLNPGSASEFHRLMLEESLPLLQQADIDVVAFGHSLDESSGYYIVRAFTSVDDLRRREDAFYGSDAWRNGPRQAVLDCIEHYASVAIELDQTVVESLRR